MQILVAIFLFVIALVLFWAWRIRKISNDTLNAFAAIFTVVAGIAAIVLFLVPAASPPLLPAEMSSPEIGSTTHPINTVIIEKTLAPSEIVTPLNAQPLTELELTENKLKLVEQKLANMAEGAWIPLPQGIFQPSIQSILDDLASANYAPPPSSAANDLVDLAKSYMNASDFNKAFATFLDASKLDENNPEPYFWMGLLLPATGGPPDVAILVLGDAIEKDTSQQRRMAMFSYMQRGILYLMARDPEQSISDFSECILISGYQQETIPVFMQTVYVNRGIAYQFLGKTREALQDYGKALDFATLKENPLVVKKIQEQLDEIDKAIK
jgi:tetratricopeptide (TPR) repeat protein